MYRGINDFYTSIVTALLLPLFLLSPIVDTARAQQFIERVSRSLVKIETNSSSASGFIWPDSAHVVTALHIVDGQERITATYVNANGEIIGSSPAEVEKVLKDSDLVLLLLRTPQDRVPLSINLSPPTIDQQLYAVGFPLDIAVANDTKVKVRFGGKQLRTILPQKVLEEMEKVPYPSTIAEILSLEANLLPGHSGAPIVDRDGKVVGIADGGLEEGAIGICWGIPASHLQQLSRSTVTRVPNAPRIQQLFAVDQQAEVGKIQVIGNIRIAKLRSRTFQQLALTADDQLGLSQLVSDFSIWSYGNPSSFRYDIYQDIESGATIAVPEGARISSRGNFAVVSVNDPRMEMKFQITPVRSLLEAGNQALIFEQQLTEANNFSQVILDPLWSYLLPMTRFGVTVRRKGIHRNVFNGFTWQTDKYYFETLATNGNTFVGVAAVNNDNTPQTLQLQMLCAQGLNDPRCAQLYRSLQIWTQMVLGVQFAGFPHIPQER